MPFTQDLMDELNMLIRFDLESNQQGLKVHGSTANAAVIAATRRLHQKGLITHSDGGYLTSMGRSALDHAQAALRLLTAGSAQAVIVPERSPGSAH